jgi:hypothetical protein
MADGMARIEFELRQTGEQFVTEYEGYKANRHRNKFSQAVDAARNGNTKERNATRSKPKSETDLL